MKKVIGFLCILPIIILVVGFWVIFWKLALVVVVFIVLPVVGVGLLED